MNSTDIILYEQKGIEHPQRYLYFSSIVPLAGLMWHEKLRRFQMHLQNGNEFLCAV